MTRGLLLLLCLSVPLAASALDLVLPTKNNALLRGRGADFYQFTDREFEGQKSTPWQGGTYGYSRTTVRTSAGVINRQFHEGLDIKPVGRDAKGDPTDVVMAVSNGTVPPHQPLAGRFQLRALRGRRASVGWFALLQPLRAPGENLGHAG